MDQQVELNARRQEWYRAYFAGDIAKLCQLELPDFTYISVQGIEDTTTRYHTINQRLMDNNWFPAASRRDDVTSSYQFVGNCCYVTGEGVIYLAPGVSHNRYMSEVWVLDDSKGWQILSLHASVVPA